MGRPHEIVWLRQFHVTNKESNLLTLDTLLLPNWDWRRQLGDHTQEQA